MSSRHAPLRVLLDTSFILPSLGIDVGKKVSKSLRILAQRSSEIHYSSFSLLESLWVLARIAPNAAFEAESYRKGLRSIMESGRYKKVSEDSTILNEAFSIYRLGHKDMIDNILYASSTQLNLKLLTLDRDLKEFIHAKRLRDTLISPDQLASTSSASKR